MRNIKNDIQLFRLLRHTKDTVEKIANSRLKKAGITIAQGHIILILWEQDEYKSTLKALEKELDLAQSTIVLMVSKMESNGFVSTYTSSEDKRVKYVCLTEKGRQVYNDVRDSMIDVQNEILSPLNEDEKITFIKLLEKINENERCCRKW